MDFNLAVIASAIVCLYAIRKAAEVDNRRMDEEFRRAKEDCDMWEETAKRNEYLVECYREARAGEKH